jgi:hypothetical protein
MARVGRAQRACAAGVGGFGGFARRDLRGPPASAAAALRQRHGVGPAVQELQAIAAGHLEVRQTGRVDGREHRQRHWRAMTC